MNVHMGLKVNDINSGTHKVLIYYVLEI